MLGPKQQGLGFRLRGALALLAEALLGQSLNGALSECFGKAYFILAERLHGSSAIKYSECFEDIGSDEPRLAFDANESDCSTVEAYGDDAVNAASHVIFGIVRRVLCNAEGIAQYCWCWNVVGLAGKAEELKQEVW
jgi:hypothetical protein